MGKAKLAEPMTPKSHLEAMSAAGFEALTWQNAALQVLDSTGAKRSEWLPRDLVNWPDKLFVEYRLAGEGSCAFDGWEPMKGHAHGGRYPTVQGALGWFKWLERQS